MTAFAFYGMFTTGQSLHEHVRGARLLERTRTAPRYRLYVVDGRSPALVPDDDGVEIECELYDVDEELLDRLAEFEPPGWNRGPLELADGRMVDAFVADRALVIRGEDISAHRSWGRYARLLSRRR